MERRTGTSERLGQIGGDGAGDPSKPMSTIRVKTGAKNNDKRRKGGRKRSLKKTYGGGGDGGSGGWSGIIARSAPIKNANFLEKKGFNNIAGQHPTSCNNIYIYL